MIKDDDLWLECPIRNDVDVRPDTPEWNACHCSDCKIWRAVVALQRVDTEPHMDDVGAA